MKIAPLERARKNLSIHIFVFEKISILIDFHGSTVTYMNNIEWKFRSEFLLRFQFHSFLNLPLVPIWVLQFLLSS